MAAQSSVLTCHSSYISFSYTYMCDGTSIKIHRCVKYIVVSSYIDFFINPNNPFSINNAHAPVSCRHFSSLSVEIKQLLLYQSKRTYTCNNTTCNHIDPSSRPLFVHDTRVLFRLYLTYQIKFYKIHVISMFKLSLIICDSLVVFERKQFCVFFYICLFISTMLLEIHLSRGEFGLITYFVSILN